MSFELAQGFLRAIYAAAPILFAALLFDRAYRLKQKKALQELLGTAFASLLIGVALAAIFSLAIGARVRVDQALLASLFFFGVMVILKGLDALAKRAGAFIFKSKPPTETRIQVDPARSSRISELLNPPLAKRWRRIGAGATRALILAGVGLPYIMAAAMVYRPKVRITGDPLSQMGWRFDSVNFPATDGTKISAWWIPAPPPPGTASTEQSHDWGRRTILLCHGLGANKLNQLHMGGAFNARGWNLLAIDFRAHGESGGQFSTFGDHERRDILGAIRWLKYNHTSNAHQIVGVGASLGAAALIAAAGEINSPEARSISGLVIYATYSDLGQLATEITQNRLPWGLGFLAKNIALPLASLHAGSNLSAFSPQRALAHNPTLPIFIIHGTRDEIIPTHHAQSLFNTAQGPKRLILLDSDHNGIIDDDASSQQAATFFNKPG